MPLAMHALLRLAPQVGQLMLNANRNLAAYESMGVPVWPDTVPDYAGPLAGFLAGLEHCETPYMATVPCDSPLFPLDLVQRLALALEAADAEIAMAATLDGATLQVQKHMFSEPRRVGKIEVTLSFPASLQLQDKDKTILQRTGDNCPVQKSIHPDIETVVVYNWG